MSKMVIVHVPVEIKADSLKTLRSLVHELRHTDLKHMENGEGHGSFKIITNGVKLRDVKEQFERLYTRQKSGDSDDGNPWPFPKKPHREEHPRAVRGTASSKKLKKLDRHNKK
jgi:TPP-dependent indolepyruvate ferredoxin oxidoreductase alpha subunit